jgi:putative transposase
VSAVLEVAPPVEFAVACRALGLARATVYRRRCCEQARPRRRERRAPSPRALRSEERSQVVEVLHSERFVDRAPAQIVATLLDEGQYLCSVRTMYRLLEVRGETRERRRRCVHPAYQRPELVATAPNQVWSWDLTKLRGPAKWLYFHLYVLLDLFSRFVVGWMLARHESGALARRLLAESCERQGIVPGQLTIHADRGSAPASKVVAQLLADLGVERSHSRPHVSNDNPFSESHFATVKGHPEFPDRFVSFEHAYGFCQRFFPWYNTEHRHSGIAYLTPERVHCGGASVVLAQRASVLDTAYARNPERFVRRPPKPHALPEAVWINPPVRNEVAAFPRIDELDPTRGSGTSLEAARVAALNLPLGGRSDDMRQ